jgi:hypothetical protein
MLRLRFIPILALLIEHPALTQPADHGRWDRAPHFSANSVVNGASLLPGLVPGAVFTIFGSHLSTWNETAAITPLPTTLGGATVTVNGLAAPLTMRVQRKSTHKCRLKPRKGRQPWW